MSSSNNLRMVETNYWYCCQCKQPENALLKDPQLRKLYAKCMECGHTRDDCCEVAKDRFLGSLNDHVTLHTNAITPLPWKPAATSTATKVLPSTIGVLATSPFTIYNEPGKQNILEHPTSPWGRLVFAATYLSFFVSSIIDTWPTSI
ncbi:hypothetical protein AYL99_03529 [Fonsecaea erecta]|uniref:Uncharacterized protein n=1 Tax=Fonsecaea erecta TaxID=1367422 RepID=A0A178ZND3_9EURO|nr:hypothetical protein AYL99_03529 [Fonsecaea erecta]OAP61328.1 hypothetical protein AYL99_03529 [Fonsecaea erecta]